MRIVPALPAEMDERGSCLSRVIEQRNFLVGGPCHTGTSDAASAWSALVCNALVPVIPSVASCSRQSLWSLP